MLVKKWCIFKVEDWKLEMEISQFYAILETKKKILLQLWNDLSFHFTNNLRGFHKLDNRDFQKN